MSTLRLTRKAGELILRLTKGPDRAAAEYVLSLGGKVRVVGSRMGANDGGLIASADKLPKGECMLTYAEVTNRMKVDDAGLANFSGCTKLLWLDLSRTKAADGCLAPFTASKQLLSLKLSQTGVTDDALLPLAGCTSLQGVYLDGTRVTDKGLAHLHACSKLKKVMCGGTAVTAAGQQALKAKLPECTIE